MQQELKKLSLGKTLSEAEMLAALSSMMGEGTESSASDAQIGAFLFAFAVRLPEPAELVGAATALRRSMIRLDVDNPSLLDTAGTGGSGHNTFNTSTASALLLAAAGVSVAKHGNRAATSACGSADVLEALGVKIDLSPERSAQILKKTGFCFLFAPHYHLATKRVQAIRRQLGFRTIFNFLGPLVNPAGARIQLIGLSEPKIQETYAKALLQLGAERAMLVCGSDRLDEISLAGETIVHEIRNSEIHTYTIAPEDFGLKRVRLEEISGASAEQSANEIREMFSGKTGPLSDIVALNAGAGLYLASKAESLAEGVSQARKLLASGVAAKKLLEIVAECHA